MDASFEKRACFKVPWGLVVADWSRCDEWVGIVIEHLFLSFIRFRTVPMATDGGRFGTAASASHMVSQSGKNPEDSSRKTRSLPVFAGRRWSDVTPWQMGMG